MADKKFSISEAIKFGWETMKRNFWFFVGVLIILAIINLASNILPSLLKTNFPVLAVIIGIIGWVFYLGVSLGFIKIMLKFSDTEKGAFSDLFSCFPLFFKFLFGLIIYSLIILAGTILLIIPGIIWAVKYQFFNYLIVDKGIGPIKALRQSGAITTGAKWDLFLYFLLVCLLNLLGTAFFGIGLFITVPTTGVATAFIYRKLSAHLSLTVPKGPIGGIPPIGKNQNQNQNQNI